MLSTLSLALSPMLSLTQSLGSSLRSSLRSSLCLSFKVALLIGATNLAYLNIAVAAPEAAPFLVPDRPGYSDSIFTVLPGRWHVELGAALTPDDTLGATILTRYGLSKRWELRLALPTLTQAFAASEADALNPDPETPEATFGGASLGAKVAYGHRNLKGSTVLMIGLPTSGGDIAINPDPILSLKSQLEHPLDRHLSVNIALHVALFDETVPAVESAYGGELDWLFGAVGAVSWSEIDWSLYTQGGGELIAGQLTPLVGIGGTLRLAYNAQIDLSLNAPLSPDGVTPRYDMGFTLGW